MNSDREKLRNLRKFLFSSKGTNKNTRYKIKNLLQKIQKEKSKEK